jgi:hypothetical protein
VSGGARSVTARVLLVLIGIWIGFLAASWAIAPATFKTADRVLADARLAQRLAPVPEAGRRDALRHLAAELNRWMFEWWGVAQLVLGVLVAVLAWRLGGASRWLALAALAIVAGQAFVLVPMIRDLGRTADFMPRPLPPEIAGRFGALHGAYAAVDLAKAAVVALLAWLVARTG